MCIKGENIAFYKGQQANLVVNLVLNQVLKWKKNQMKKEVIPSRDKSKRQENSM